MSRKTKPKTGPLPGWNPTKFFLNFYDVGKMIWFRNHPVDAQTLMNDQEYAKRQCEFAKNYANDRMAHDLALFYDLEASVWITEEQVEERLNQEMLLQIKIGSDPSTCRHSVDDCCSECGVP